jgi:hypothetical protein
LADAFIAQSLREAGGALTVEVGETSLTFEARLAESDG